MKKLLFFSTLLWGFLAINATELPQPSVRVLPQSFGFFDAFVVTWADNPTEPYHLKIVDDSGISVVKNLVEDLRVTSGLTEYQETENSKNYPDSRLVVTISMLETQIGSLYTLTVPAGAVEINLPDSETMLNEEVTYSFTLQANENTVTLPDPDIIPGPGIVTELSEIEMSWTGVLGTLNLLNEHNKIDAKANIPPVSVLYNGEKMTDPLIDFYWSSRHAFTEGSAGDILKIALIEGSSLPDGEYIITIPANYLQITDIETGSLYNDEIVISYTVRSEEVGAVSNLYRDENEEVVIYNLNGVRMNPDNLPKGIYIVNGKKVIL